MPQGKTALPKSLVFLSDSSDTSGLPKSLVFTDDSYDEGKFQSWYKSWAGKTGIDPNPDNPLHKYDYRAAYRAGVTPEVTPEDNLFHWPSEFKADDHPNRFVKTDKGVLDSKTGKLSPSLPPSPPQTVEPPSVGEFFMGRGGREDPSDPPLYVKRGGEVGILTLPEVEVGAAPPPQGTRYTKIPESFREEAMRLPQTGIESEPSDVGERLSVGKALSTLDRRAYDYMHAPPELVGTNQEGLGRYLFRKIVDEPVDALSHAISKVQNAASDAYGDPALRVGEMALGAFEAGASPIAVANPLIESYFRGAQLRPTGPYANPLEDMQRAGTVAGETVGRVLELGPEGRRLAGEVGGTVAGVAPFLLGAGMVKTARVPRKPGLLPLEGRAREMTTIEEVRQIAGEVYPQDRPARLPQPARPKRQKAGVPDDTAPTQWTDDSVIQALHEMRDADGQPVYTPTQIANMTSKERLYLASGGREGVAIEGAAVTKPSTPTTFPSGTTVEQAVAPAEHPTRPAVRLKSGEIIEGSDHGGLKQDPRYTPGAEIGFIVDNTFVSAKHLDAAKGDFATAVELAKGEKAEAVEAPLQSPSVGKGILALKTRDGKILSDKDAVLHSQIVERQGVRETQIVDTGFLDADGNYVSQSKPKEPVKAGVNAEPATPDPKVVEKKLFTLRDKLNRGRYKGRAADLTEAEMLARKNGYDVVVDPGSRKVSIVSSEGKALRKQPEVKMNEKAADPILLEDIPPETRTRIQDILAEVDDQIDVTSLSRDQIRAAIKDIKQDAGKEASHRAQMLIEELLKADREGTVGVVTNSAPGIGREVQGFKVDDLLEEKYDREARAGIEAPGSKAGDPITFDKTEAGEQGSFATLDPAKIPDRKPSGISHEQQIEGTMFEKPKTPGAPQEEIFGGKTAPSREATDYIQKIANPEKRAFAEAYQQWILDGREGAPPKPGKMHALTEQGVRDRLDSAYPGGASGAATWADAATESLARFRDKGLSPDRPSGNLAAGLDPSNLIDPAKAAYIIEPLMKKALADAKGLIREGKLSKDEFSNFIRERLDDIFEDNPVFAGMTTEQRQALLESAATATRGIQFNPKTGSFERKKEMAANLRLERFEEGAQEGVAKLVAQEDPQTIEAQRRGIRSQEVTEAAAKSQGNVVERARTGQVKPGEAFNAEQLEALDSELNRLGLMKPEELLKNEDPKAVANLLRTVHGAHAEAGRALQILGKDVAPGVAENFQKIAEMTNDPKLKKIVEETIDRLEKKKPIPPGWWEKIAEWGRNMKLAATSSVVRSVVGNSIMQLFKVPEAALSGQNNIILEAMTGKRRDRYSREAAADVIGTWIGARDGFAEAWRMIKEQSLPGEENLFQQREIGRVEGAIGGRLGKIVRTPQRMQGAIDVVFRRPAERGLIARFAVRKALQENLTGRALRERIEHLKTNPTVDMLASAATDAQYLTFQNKLGSMGHGVNAIRLAHPGVQVLVPFFNTGANLFKAAVERTPFSVITPSFHQAVLEAFTKNTKPSAYAQRLARTTGKEFTPQIGHLSDKLARMTAGSAFLAVSGVVTYRILDGEITGRPPKSAAERDTWERAGKKPYSMKIGDTWYSYRGYEPVSAWLGLLADYNTGYKDEGVVNGIYRSTVNLARNFSDNPFLVGIRDAADYLADPEGNPAERIIAGIAVGMLVPTIAQQTARIIDPAQRKTEGVGEAIRARIPGMSQGLLPKRTVFGEPIVAEKPALRLAAISVSTAKRDKVEDELQRLGITLGWPSDMYAGIDLTPQQEDQLIEKAGKGFKKLLDDAVASTNWSIFTDGIKRDHIRYLQNGIREMQRLYLFPDVKMKGLLKQAEEDLTGGAVDSADREKTMKALRRAVGQ